MKTMIAALFVGVIGIILVVWGVSTLMDFAEFTQTVHGTVVRKSTDGVIVLFKDERVINSGGVSARFAGVSEIQFPITDRTRKLEPGNEVEGYCPPGNLPKVRLDRDFPVTAPRTALAAGGALVLVAVITLIVLRIRGKRRRMMSA